MTGATFFAIPDDVVAFAALRLMARPGGRVNVGFAYEEYAAFAQRRGTAPVSRAVFGATLHKLGAQVGGGRDGDAVTGLIWRENAAPLLSPAVVPGFDLEDQR